MFIANILNFTHRIIVYFMLFGFILPEKYSWIHGITFPLVYLHWKTNEGNCVLTEYELKLRGIKEKPSGMDDYPFMIKIFKEFGIDMTNEEIKKYIIPYLTIVSIISLIRTLQYK